VGGRVGVQVGLLWPKINVGSNRKKVQTSVEIITILFDVLFLFL
jgi:hypothetical protein